MPYQTGSERDTAKDYDPMRAAFDGLTAAFEDVKPDSLEAMFFEADTARMEAEAEVKRLTGLLGEAREAIEGRLDESVDSFEINVVGAPHADKVRVGDCEWFCRAPDVAKLIIDIRAILTRLKETPNAA